MDDFAFLQHLMGPELRALGMVIMIDLVMSGDNAIIIGIAASQLPPPLRQRAIMLGIVLATVTRIVFAAITVQLLQILGLTLAGGLLLLWVSWRMWRDMHRQKTASATQEKISANMQAAAKEGEDNKKALRTAVINIIFADVSMSLDNVLAVAGASREHVWVLIFGLVLSITLMAVASTLIARWIERYHWIAYIGLAVVAYVAIDMIWRGAGEITTNHLGLGGV
jgi:YjbE family integral membrane protein